MELKKWQELFVKSVTNEISNEELENAISPCGLLTSLEALEVYQSDYLARMQEALGKNYEATWLVLGDDDFLSLSEEFIRSHPSELTNLTSYGDQFPEFLSAKEVSTEVIQMADFERSFWKFFHASVNPSIEITQAMLEESHFDLSGIMLFESDLRLDLIWQNRESGGDALAEINVYEECCLCLFKAHEKVEVRKLSSEAYKLLLNLKEVGKITKLPDNNATPADWAIALEALRSSKIKS